MNSMKGIRVWTGAGTAATTGVAGWRCWVRSVLTCVDAQISIAKVPKLAVASDSDDSLRLMECVRGGWLGSTRRHCGANYS